VVADNLVTKKDIIFNLTAVEEIWRRGLVGVKVYWHLSLS